MESSKLSSEKYHKVPVESSKLSTTKYYKVSVESMWSPHGVQ